MSLHQVSSIDVFTDALFAQLFLNVLKRVGKWQKYATAWR
jgi:hypothetical protein